ncbi:MAG: hypothetical protein PSX80_02980 [bacterium]|nr:hypothetical protein [bacterium]
MSLFKKFILWEYSRETSVYVIFCLMIVAFIFLTPKEHFERRDRLATQTSRLIVQASDFSPEKDILQQRVRDMSGNPEAVVLDWREKKNNRGETVYEVDIR